VNWPTKQEWGVAIICILMYTVGYINGAV